MKKLIIVLCLTGTAFSAQASEYGCKVLRCLANPASNGDPKGVSGCIEPIDQLYDDLSHARPFPTCDLSDGNDGSSYACQVYDPYDPCPVPLVPAARGAYVVEGQVKRTKGDGPPVWSLGEGVFDLKGTPQISEVTNDYGYSIGPRACVGESLGAYRLNTNTNADMNVEVVKVFERVIWQPPQNPRAIDVYIDHHWYQRVRW